MALLAFAPHPDPHYAALMSSRLLRALFTLAAFVAAWFVVSPAQAEAAHSAMSSFVPATLAPPAPAPAPETVPPDARAPLCDARGAITFAPPPQMQDVEVSLDTGLTAEDCLGGTSTERAHRAAPGRAPLPLDASSASSDAAVLAVAVALAASARELLPAPAASTSCSRPGIRSTVDRPPRA